MQEDFRTVAPGSIGATTTAGGGNSSIGMTSPATLRRNTPFQTAHADWPRVLQTGFSL